MGLTAAQLEEHDSGIGGSDAPAACGVSPWKTQTELYYEKTGQIEPPDLSDKEQVRWGNLLEDLIAQEFTTRTGLKVRRSNQTLRHRDKKRGYMLAHIDRRIVGQRAGLEVKTTGFFGGKDLGDEGTDAVPDTWLVQVAHYLEVTGFDAFYIAALVGGQKLRIFRVEPDPDLLKMVVERERWFWEECVLPRIPPPPSTLSDLSLLYPKDSGGTVTATPDMLVALAELKAAAQQAKVLEAHQTALEFTVKAALGESSTLVDASGTPLATWRSQTVNRLDQARLKKEAPEVFQSFTTASTHRVLRLR